MSSCHSTDRGSRKECNNYTGITLLSVNGKVFAIVPLNRVKDKLRSIRCQEQSGFIPGQSTTERISTLSYIIQTRKEFDRPSWIAYIKLKSAFDSVDRQSLWLLPKSIRLPSKILNPMKAMYTDTCSCVCGWCNLQLVRDQLRCPPRLHHHTGPIPGANELDYGMHSP